MLTQGELRPGGRSVNNKAASSVQEGEAWADLRDGLGHIDVVVNKYQHLPLSSPVISS